MPSDELPVLRENVKQQFSEAKTKLNSWVRNFSKKMDGDVNPDPPRTSGGGYSYGRSEQTRYDADPYVIGDDFTHLNLQDNESVQRDDTARRPLEKFNKPLDEDDDLYAPSPAPPAKPPRPSSSDAKAAIQSKQATKPKKTWEPLSAKSTGNEGGDAEAAERDPFALGDSDEDIDQKLKQVPDKDVDLKPEATERLKHASVSSAKKPTVADELQEAALDDSGTVDASIKKSIDEVQGVGK